MRHLIAIGVAIALVGFFSHAEAQQQYDAGGKARNSNYCQTTIPGDTPCPANPSATLTPSATVGVTTAQCAVACASKITTGAHGLYGLNFSATVTGTMFLYDATSCAANGTVTPLQAIAYPTANQSIGVSWGDIPMIFATGIAVCFSSTGPYTATASTTAFISYGYK